MKSFGSIAFLLIVPSAADLVSVVRDKMPEEVGAVHREELATLKGVRNDGIRNEVDVEAAVDPYALACLGVVAAYFAYSAMIPRKREDSDAASGSSQATSSSTRSLRRRGADRFALVVNQKLTKLETVDEVLDFALASAETGRTDIVNVVTAIHRSAKLVAHKSTFDRIRVGQDRRLAALLGQLHDFLKCDDIAPHILSRAVGNTSWALAKLQYREDGSVVVVPTLQKLFCEFAEEFRPEELMNAVWAFGELRRDRLDGEAEALEVAAAACRCTHKLPQFLLQQVVYFSWALARLSSIPAVKADPEARDGLRAFLAQIVERAHPDVTRLNSKNLAMLTWALASLHTNLSEESGATALLLAAAAGHAEKKLSGFLPGEVASILWAVNKVSVRAPSFYVCVREHILSQGLRGYNTQDIATMLCAFVKTECGSPALYRLLSAKARAVSRDFSRSEKQMVQWAFDQLQIDQPL